MRFAGLYGDSGGETVTMRKVTMGIALVLVLVGIAACSKPEASKADAAPVKPVTETKPIFRPSQTSPAVWGPGDLYNMLVVGEESNGALFQFEAIVPAGGGPPPHVHLREDETFYVVKGTLEILLGDKVYQAKAGDFVYVPRGTVHRFKNTGTETAVQLATFVPSGMDGFFREVFPEVTDRSAAAPPITDELIRRMKEAAPKYGIEFPLPPEPKTP